MRDLILRQSHAACRYRHGIRPRLSAVGLTQHARIRSKSDRAPTALAQSLDLSASQRNHDTSIDIPRISADKKYSIQGLVANLDTTRPAPLDLPEPPHPLAWPSAKSKDPSKWDFKYLFQLGKAYGRFYWTGIKNVWANYKTRQQVVKRLNGTPADMAARVAGSPQRISYNEYELLLRAKRDVTKLLPFGLVFAICGEFTPLVIVLLGSRVVPGTCVIPKQITQDRQKILDKEKSYMKLMADTWVQRKELVSQDQTRTPSIMRPFLLPDAYRLNLTPMIASNAFSAPFRSLYWRFVLSKRFRKYSDEMLSTAVLIRREGGWVKRSPLDMWEWGNKYGMFKLRQYVKDAIAAGQNEVVDDKMKQTLLKAFEDETRAIVDRAMKAQSDSGSSGPRYLHHDPLLSDTPDAKALKTAIEQEVESVQRHKEVQVKKD